MTMYRTIPERVEAVRFDDTQECFEQLRKMGLKNEPIRNGGDLRLIVTWDDCARVGDYVVRSPFGTFFSCRPEVFEKRHTLADLPDRDTPMPARREIAKEPTREVDGGIFGRGTTIWFCPRCNMFNTPSHKFCWKCGQALTFDFPATRAGEREREETNEDGT